MLVCGDDPEAKAVVGSLVRDIPDLRWVDCGALSMARIAETMTALLDLGEPHVQGERRGRSASSGATAWGDPRA